MNDISFMIKVDTIDSVNFASAQNAVPILKNIIIQNSSDEVLAGIKLQFTPSLPFCRSKTWVIDQIAASNEFVISDLRIEYDFSFFESLNEAERGELHFALTKDDTILVEQISPIRILAKNQWGGLGIPSILAAFISPNEPAIARICKSASSILENGEHNGALDGYQSKDPKRAYMLTAGVWSVITGMNLSYVEPPASFESQGQKIRDAKQIETDRLATCLDSSLLFASTLEAIGLNSIIIFINGHAFIGVWLIDKTLPSIEEYDIIELRKAIAAKELITFETTLVTHRPVSSFPQAIEATRKFFTEANEENFVCAIDIRRSRHAGITPLASRSIQTDNAVPVEDIAPATLPQMPDFGIVHDEIIEDVPQTPQDRINRWQQKLLDLTLRNKLLNFKDTKQTVSILSPDLPRLEDLLAGGKKFRMISLNDENPLGDRDPELHRQQHGKDIHEEFALGVLERKQLCVPLTRKEMYNRLVSLYRKANSDLAEGGANTLYLTMGFLRWRKNEKDSAEYRAPILLLPVTLTRKSAQSDFYLVRHEDEVRINSTLLQFLQRDFGLQVHSLEATLPIDDSGVDVPLVFTTMRKAVRDISGFEVIEDVALSTFSFAKYLMWKDLVDRTDDLRNNRLVKHLIDNPDKPFNDERGAKRIPSSAEIDKRIHPRELATPLPADSSQLSAIVAAMEGHDFVIIGPPGTGKSQTIANIIAQCLYTGKRVLFVAEKAAALNVVHRRLCAYGLGDICLELHSNKGDRKKILAQLGKAWDRSAHPASQWDFETDKLRETRDRLNAYSEQLHKSGTHGFSIFQAIGVVLGQHPKFKLSFEHLKIHDSQTFMKLEEVSTRAFRVYKIAGYYNYFKSITNTEHSFAWENALLESAEALLATLEPFRKSIEELLTKIELHFNKDNLTQITHLEQLHKFALITSKQDFSDVFVAGLPYLFDELNNLREEITVTQECRPNLVATYENAEIKRIPIDDIDRQWREANSKMWPFSFFGRRRLTKFLQSYAAAGNVDVERDLPFLQKIQHSLKSIDENGLAVLPFFAGEDTNIVEVTAHLKRASNLQQALEKWHQEAMSNDASNVVVELIRSGKSVQPDVLQALEAFHAQYERYISAYEAYNKQAGGMASFITLSELKQDINALLKHKTQLRDWVEWVKVKDEAINLGLSPFLEALGNGRVVNPAQEFRVAYFNWWLPLAIDDSLALKSFRHWSHEDLIKEFKKHDENVQKFASTQVLARSLHGLPARDAVPRRSELGTLRHQLGLQRPSLSVRKLIESMPDTFTKLAPCMLMSPLSIAQYIPAHQTQFDIVIFDEASQITTWDAVGAIARAKQSIIVGDPKQLPPTNFFGRNDDDTDEDLEEYEKDLPSILEESTAAGLPELQLNWHYRSQDESLIAFSNHHYYNGRLITFPSPKNDLMAITFHKNEGIYGRGKGRTNPEEAQDIVSFVTTSLKKWLELAEDKRPTLGVITFNIQQQELILNLLDKARQDDPALEWFFSDERVEPVIVKNLENIQGDERDIICFSITFGRDIANKLSMSFGALNKDGGEKRLNVAVTRARAEMHVFSAIVADDIDTSRTKALGVKHLQNFLDYAQRGSVALAAMHSDSQGDTESPFEEAVMAALQAKGWEVRPQIGVSNYRIDLGIVHPDNPGAYLAGVECDGATYHSSANARDRDKIREEVLRGLGWNIVRIWSTDWFMNPTEALERVHEELTELLKNSSQFNQGVTNE